MTVPQLPAPASLVPAVLRLTAFADGADGGNPAGVVLDASTLDEARMQQIAAEVGYAETAFVVEGAVGGDDRAVRTRYFSPLAEVPFCGHATIATAVALADERGPGPFRFDTAVGPVVIETTREAAAEGEGVLRASFTSVEPSTRALDDTVADELLGLLGLTRGELDPAWPLTEAFAGNWHPVVPVRSRAVFDAFGFDPGAVRELMDRRGWAGTVTVVCTEGVDLGVGVGLPSIEARNLFPVGDITEDPATGSAAAALGASLRAGGLLAPPARFTVRQGRHVGRPSLLVVDVPPAGGITVSGTASLVVG